MSVQDFIMYVIAQCLGAVVGAGILYLIVSGRTGGYNLADGLGANSFTTYGLQSAFVWEAVATFLFLVTILGVTQKGSPTMLAGLAIGLTLTAIHLVGIPVTGVSVNPARSLGPALFTQGLPLQQLWLFIVAPFLGAAVAGLLFRNGVLSAES